MTLASDIRASASSLREVSAGLASALRLAAARPSATSTVLETFREAESLSLSVDAVLDVSAPLLSLLTPESSVVGAKLGAPSAKIRNGFDSLGTILLTLLDASTEAVVDVASNKSLWALSPLQARQSHEAMVIHHGQLRAMYGICHLASMIIGQGTVERSLFLDVAGAVPRPDLEPRKWRAAINTEPLFGRFFGFQYSPEMRNFLLGASIARGSIDAAAKTTPEAASPIVRNIAALGWGWVFSSIVIANNLGVSIQKASQIGVDGDGDDCTIEHVRAFMNLPEDPFVSGVAALASADVAVNFEFEIRPGEGHCDGGEEVEDDGSRERSLIQAIPAPPGPIAVRLISFRKRPIAFNKLHRRRVRAAVYSRAPNSAAGASPLEHGPIVVDHTQTPETVAPPKAHDVSSTAGAPPPVEVVERDGVLTSGLDDVVADNFLPPVRSVSDSGGSTVPAEGLVVGSRKATTQPSTVGLTLSSFESIMRGVQSKFAAASLPQKTGGADIYGSASAPERSRIGDGLGGAARTLSATLNGVADSSVLATAIKSELGKLQSNVASFWEPTRYEAASTLIVHFHGGGFVSQSSAGHAIYLKEWAVDIPDAVILSVDYRLAPENPYPAALDDCLYAYQWALNNLVLVGTEAKRVVFAGDSAGGNLAVAVALKARTNGIRAPDGIALAYPALYVNVAWSASRLLSFFDPLLPLSILDLCLRAYVPPGEKGYANSLISPMIASPDGLRNLPPVSIICGSLDPLLDDSVQFMHNLREQGRECDDFEVLDTLPHGFLNMVHVNRATREGCHFLSRRIAKFLKVPFSRPRRESDNGGGPDGTSGCPPENALVGDGHIDSGGVKSDGGKSKPTMPLAAFDI